MGNVSAIWTPSPERIAGANLTAFMRVAAARWQRSLPDYAALHRWSVDHPEEFWRSMWEYGEVRGDPGPVVVAGAGMPGTRWFPEARLNFAENLLRARDDGDALVFWGEDKVRRRLSRGELFLQVARLAAAMRAEGVRAGDRVAAYMPNLPETVVVFLAAASLGAVFTSASPDFGVQGVLDRFGQVEPKLLFVADGYYYNGKTVDSLDRVARIAELLPSVRRVVVAPYVRGEGHDVAAIRHGVMLSDFVAPFQAEAGIEFARLPFDHPLGHHVLVRDHGRAQVHRSWRRWRAAAALEGASIARRRETGRPAVLLHHLRLDDVELAGLRAGFGCDAAALRRVAVPRSRRDSVRLRRRGRHDAFRHLGQVYRRGRKGRPDADSQSSTGQLAGDVLDRQSAGGRELRLRVRRHQARHSVGVDFRRHGYRVLLRRRQSHRSGLSGRNSVRWTGHGRRRCRSTMASRFAAPRGNWSAPGHFR